MEINKNKLEFKDSLLKAKQLGYSEANPTSDLNGEDVASKLKILTALAFNSFINNKSILVEGIKNIDQADINNANQLGYKIKLVGVAELANNKIILNVISMLVKDKPNANVLNAYIFMSCIAIL